MWVNNVSLACGQYEQDVSFPADPPLKKKGNEPICKASWAGMEVCRHPEVSLDLNLGCSIYQSLSELRYYLNDFIFITLHSLLFQTNVQFDRKSCEIVIHILLWIESHHTPNGVLLILFFKTLDEILILQK